MKHKVAAIILNYNNWPDTLACLDSLLVSQVKPAMLVVIDNASTGPDLDRIRQWAQNIQPPPRRHTVCPARDRTETWDIELLNLQELSTIQIFLIAAEHNNGYAAGNNLGIKLALAYDMDAVWILNNDTVVSTGALNAMQQRLFAEDKPGLCGCLLVYLDNGLVQCRGGGVVNKWSGIARQDGNMLEITRALSEDASVIERRINFINGASVMASRSFLENVGLMDERFFLYYEERDWAWRGEGRYSLAYAPAAVVYHKEGASTGWSAKKFRPRSLFTLLHSRLWLTTKHAPYALPTVFLALGYSFLRMIGRRFF